MTARQKILGLVAVVAVLALFVGAVSATSISVGKNAEEIAGLQPYCIQVADGNSADYRPARSWLDMSILTMRGVAFPSGYLQHHAILLVGDAAKPRLYHWSYWRGAFQQGVVNGQMDESGPAVTCLPIRQFVSKLPTLINEPFDRDYVRYSAHEAYRIPVAWQARWNGGSSRTLLLATAAPVFQPLVRRWGELSPGQRDSNSIFIDWNPSWVLSLIKSKSGGALYEQTAEFGLSKTKITIRGKDDKDYVSYRYLNYAGDRGEKTTGNITVIDCYAPSEKFPSSCQHRFINRGRHFCFRHRSEDVSNWQHMQRRILDLMASFEVSDSAI